jgi:hypothetical protein
VVLADHVVQVVRAEEVLAPLAPCGRLRHGRRYCVTVVERFELGVHRGVGFGEGGMARAPADDRRSGSH